MGTIWFPSVNRTDGFVAKYVTVASGEASRVYFAALADLGSSSGSDPSGSDRGTFANGIAVDAAGNAYLTGRTRSPKTFPITENVFQDAFRGGKKCAKYPEFQWYPDLYLKERTLRTSVCAVDVMNATLNSATTFFINVCVYHVKNNKYLLLLPILYLWTSILELTERAVMY